MVLFRRDEERIICPRCKIVAVHLYEIKYLGKTKFVCKKCKKELKEEY